MLNVFSSKKAGWALMALAVVFFVARNVEMAVVRQTLAGLEQKSLYPLKKDRRSPTGYEGGQRSEVFSPDGYHWVMQTQRMVADGDLRVRRVGYDNNPEGREVHWSSGPRWWIASVAWVWGLCGGESGPVGIEQAGLWAGPLFLLLFLAVLVPAVWRWQGGLAAGFVALGMVLVQQVGDMFSFADPDHHGLVAAAGMLTVMFLHAGGGGWVDDAGGRKARRCFIASGFFGGAGLWISSATQVPVLLGLGAGIVGGIWWFGREARRSVPGPRPVPELWRWWGAAGAVSSAGFYLLEYFPSHFGMRLEVNHPLYAVAWLGAGELLHRFMRSMTGGGFAKTGREQAWVVAAVAGVLALPLTILVAGDSTFWVGDRLLWALHRDYILEFCSVWRRLADVEPARWLTVFNLLPVVVFLLCWCIFRRGLVAVEKARLMIVLAPALLFFALSLYQVRWGGESCALSLAVLAVATGYIVRGEVKGRASAAWRMVLAALALATALPGAQRIFSTGLALVRGEKGLSKLDVRLGVLRDLSRWLRARVGGGPCVVLGGPSATTALIYHGGFKGLGTLYWENKDGLHAMVDIFSTTQDEMARDLVRRHGITHIIVVSWDAFASESARLALGLRRGEAAPENTFQSRLAKGQGCPFWLRPVQYPAPEIEGLKDEYILVYEVVPEQSREEAALRYGQLLFERGEQQNAQKFLAMLASRYPDYLQGWIALAQVQLCLEDAGGFRASIARVEALRGRDVALALDDRIGLAAVLASAHDPEGMRGEIRRCVDLADEAGLRKLNANTLLCFALFAQATGEGDRRPEIMRLAAELLPTDMVRQLRESAGGR